MDAGCFTIRFWARLLLLAVFSAVLAPGSFGAEEVNPDADDRDATSDPTVVSRAVAESDALSSDTIQPVSLYQPRSFVPAPLPRIEAQPRKRTSSLPRDIDRTYEKKGLSFSAVSRARIVPSLRYSVPTSDAGLRAATDAGNLIGKSPFAPPVWVQQRNPIVSEPRISGSRVGRIASSGSYWVPARIDLDTMVSKFDSRIVGDLNIVPGPYTSRLGPDFRFIDLELLASPRSESLSSGGESSFEFNSNGERFFGRQSLHVADDSWGIRVGYGHRTANDYTTGGSSGIDIPSSYKSRELDVAAGIDLTESQHLEFHYLHLDQTDVELAGQAFDLDQLKTNGYEVDYLIEDLSAADSLSVNVWYNETDFKGSAQRSGKRRIIPFLDDIRYVGFTDVESLSFGYRTELEWDFDEYGVLLAGTDLRLLRQDLDEISSGRIGINIFTDRNSPIPRSYSVNPGLFFEYDVMVAADVALTAGARLDVARNDIIAGRTQLFGLGLATPTRTFAEIVGTDDFDRDFLMASAFLAADWQIDDCWSMSLGGGYAQRPPTLTELYVAESFMFLLQNGLNAVTGDPELRQEHMLQIDASLQYESEDVRASLRGFHAWVFDYVTFENAAIRAPFGFTEQINLRYVNTELATLAGAEARYEWDMNPWLTAFGTLAFVEGRDHTRNGDFATSPSSAGSPAAKVSGLPRGTFSGISGGAEEPLPMMPPLKSRLGIRIHKPTKEPEWGVELSALVVSAQERVATSLLEQTTPSYTTWDVRGFWEPTDQLSIFAGIENFTDESYREHFDFRNEAGNEVRQPGLNTYVGMQLSY